jgi:hypothetical protein
MAGGPRATARTGTKLLMPRGVRYLDVGVAIWVATWLAIAAVMASSVRDLGDFGDTVVAASDGLEETSTGLGRVSSGLRETARALSALSALPFVGELGPRIERAATEVDRIALRVEAAAREARRTGRATREDAQDFSVLLGLTIAALGVLPSLLMYLLVRPLLVAAARTGRADPHA